MVFGRSKKQAEVSSEPTSYDDKGLPTTTTHVSGSGDSTAIDTNDGAANLAKFRKMHRWDPHMDVNKLDTIDNVVNSGDVEKEAAFEESLLGEDSPYAEVRAAVKPTDDPTMVVDTIRCWVIGMLICTLVGGANILLTLRPESLAIQAPVVQLVVYPLGTAWAKFMPKWEWTMFGRRIVLNDGHFTIKEHALITAMAAAGTGYSYAILILLAQEVYYGQHFGWGYQITLIMSTQALGFGLAGMSRRFLVWPSAMVWPSTLINTTILQSLHNHTPSDPAATNGWKIGRYKFFLIAAGTYYLYAWFPSLIAPFLSYFCFITWAAPNNVVVNQIFGGITGIGILPITFDWSIIAGFTGSPLYVPGFALANNAFGLLIVVISALGLVYAGPLAYKYFPVSANSSYDNKGKSYNVTRVLTDDFQLNEEAFRAYSPLILGPMWVMAYGMSFASLSSIVTHVALYNGKQVWARARDAKNQEADIHLKLMRKYKEAPEWWFIATFAISFAFAMICSQVYTTHLTWWALIIALLLGIVFFIPVSMIYAITANAPGLNVITEFIIGYMQPGKPVAMMMFKSFGYMMEYNAMTYTSDMKIGHYMKIPPRSMFRGQLFAVVWLSIVQVCVYNFLRNNIEGICTPEAKAGLVCPGARTYFTASIIWGVIGPGRMFGPGSMYSWIHYFWIIGVGATVVAWLLARRYPKTWLRYVYMPAVFSASGLIPPATCYMLLCYILFGTIFNVVIKRKFPGWWYQYNYILSGALDIGNGLCALSIVLFIGLTDSAFPEWWGNTGFLSTMDGERTAVLRHLKGDEIIGPKTWS